MNENTFPATIPLISIRQTSCSSGEARANVIAIITADFTINSRISPAAAAAAFRQALKYPLKHDETAPVTSAAGISLTAKVISIPEANRLQSVPAKQSIRTDTAELIIRQKPIPYIRTLSGDERGFPISSDIRRLVQRKAFPLESIPANPKNEPVSVNIPMAEVPSFFVIKTFNSNADESRNNCITVNRTVSLIIFFPNINSSPNPFPKTFI